jgi:hypothetical protein
VSPEIPEDYLVKSKTTTAMVRAAQPEAATALALQVIVGDAAARRPRRRHRPDDAALRILIRWVSVSRHHIFGDCSACVADDERRR